MEEKEVIKQGESFERLLNNEDFKVLQEFVQGEIQKNSGLILGGVGVESFETYQRYQGILLGLAIPQSYMENIVKQMKVFKEERRLEAKRLEEEKRARTKR